MVLEAGFPSMLSEALPLRPLLKLHPDALALIIKSFPYEQPGDEETMIIIGEKLWQRRPVLLQSIQNLAKTRVSAFCQM